MEKELTPRQLREHAAYEAEKAVQKPNSGHMTAADRLDFYRKQAGWPPLRRR